MVDSDGDGIGTPHAVALCKSSGNMMRPWAEDGAECWCVDLRNDGTTEDVGDGRIHYVEADVREWEPPVESVTFGAAFPPCTDLSVSGARWMKKKGLHALAEAIETVAACRDTLSSLGCPWMVENPVSTLSTYWREPDWKFDPFQYDGYTCRDEAYTKETWLWTGGGFRMPVPERDGVTRETADDRIHKEPPSEERGAIRSETPAGFARAVFLAHQEPEQYARADADGREQAAITEVTH